MELMWNEKETNCTKKVFVSKKTILSICLQTQYRYNARTKRDDSIGKIVRKRQKIHKVKYLTGRILTGSIEKKKLVTTMRTMMMLSNSKTMTSLNRLFLWSFACAYVSFFVMFFFFYCFELVFRLSNHSVISIYWTLFIYLTFCCKFRLCLYSPVVREHFISSSAA